ncbi:MAG TPA: winged helix-turn-helix domain-containing protein [Vicinamibacterales bacterium]
MPTGARFIFEPFELDPARRRLTASGEPVAISERQLDVLLLLVARAGQIISKDDLLQVGWKDVAVGDNSLEQAISGLRKLLGARHIETVPRRGYRFGVPVTRMARRESDAALDALLAPHRAFIEGRAALETLEGDRVARAREVFESVLRSAPDDASAHVGLANACVMQFEMTRADPVPDAAALALATDHAREACRLDPRSGEAWATLGFVLDRTNRIDARAAAKHAVTLEPDNWRHHFRLAYVSWGEERLRAAHRTLALLPDFPLAHWLAATVHVARQVLGEAERELAAGLAHEAGQSTGGSRFGAVALHWLMGLIHLERGDEIHGLEELERELSFEHGGQLYARECAANTWYSIGALRLRQRRPADASAAFAHALERVPTHPMAHVGLAAADLKKGPYPFSEKGVRPLFTAPPHGGAVDAALLQAAQLAVAGAHAEAARIVGDALAGAAPGSAGWLLPLEPLLHVSAHPDIWAPALAHLRNRAA